MPSIACHEVVLPSSISTSMTTWRKIFLRLPKKPTSSAEFASGLKLQIISNRFEVVFHSFGVEKPMQLTVWVNLSTSFRFRSWKVMFSLYDLMLDVFPCPFSRNCESRNIIMRSEWFHETRVVCFECSALLQICWNLYFIQSAFSNFQSHQHLYNSSCVFPQKSNHVCCVWKVRFKSCWLSNKKNPLFSGQKTHHVSATSWCTLPKCLAGALSLQPGGKFPPRRRTGFHILRRNAAQDFPSMELGPQNFGENKVVVIVVI